MSSNGSPSSPSAVTVGIDVGGSRTRVGVVDALGRVLALATSPTPRGGEALIDHLVEATVEIGKGTLTRPVGCGVGVPGKLDAEGVLSFALNLGIEQPLSVQTRLEDRLGMPVRVCNDVNLAA